MNEDLLIELLKKAPTLPSSKEMAEWEAQFEKDYPKPWVPERNAEWELACNLTSLKVSGFPLDPIYFNAMRSYQHRNGGPHWNAWRHECEQKFIEDYPSIWAKRKYAELTA